ncbi:MAG: histone deacetylase family protein [Phycisphaeraceae bacterium]|nr:histone deacetylase family protein [Phycisphaerales bacterium]MCB9842304.1 histone deacetylase family protein [Phycisphaeraceae bacterium]
MFRIRQIAPDAIPANRRLIEEAKSILAHRLPGLPRKELESFEDRLRDPLAYQFHAMLFVADDMRGRMLGMAYVSHAPDAHFCLLDYIVTPEKSRGGVGAALYERIRDACRALDVAGLFFECLPDDAHACEKPEHAKQNAARLRFYERFGARPIINTAYEEPMSPGQMDMPHLVFDDLGSGKPLSRDEARTIVRTILERKYEEMCPPEYIDGVVASIVDDPVRLREPRYTKHAGTKAQMHEITGEGLIALVVNDQHEIHHVKERGYVEAPARVRAILKGIEPTGRFVRVDPKHYPEKHIREVHDGALVDYLKKACAEVPEGRSVYPYVFPVRNQTRPPKDRAYAAGYYCIDTFTPINANAWKAAVRAVDCSLTAADAILAGQRLAYALVRPPGHHAEHKVFGGFCYFCNAAVAAHHLSRHGRVAILDIDYHHGNGQQDIFYARRDVLTVSIHGHPSFAYPFFTGFDEETGQGEGEGFNLNITLPERIDAKKYASALDNALSRIASFAPDFIVVALGFDTGKGDPTGTWPLTPEDFASNAQRISALGLPTLVIQEGGYRTVTLGSNARAFFTGLARGAQQ